MDAGSSIVAYEEWLDDRRPARCSTRSQATTRTTASRPSACATGSRRDAPKPRRRTARSRGPSCRDARPRPSCSEQLDEVDGARRDARRRRAATIRERAPTSSRPAGCSRSCSHWHRREDKPDWWTLLRPARADRPTRSSSTTRVHRRARATRATVGHGQAVDRPPVRVPAAGPQVQGRTTRRSTRRPSSAAGDGRRHRRRLDRPQARQPQRRPRTRARSIPPGPIQHAPRSRPRSRASASGSRDHGIDAPGPYARRATCCAAPPRSARPAVRSRRRRAPLDAACRLGAALDGGCLAIQGPPGPGKTYTGAHMILDLARGGQAGRRHRAQPRGDRQPARAKCRRRPREARRDVPRAAEGRATTSTAATPASRSAGATPRSRAALAAGEVDCSSAGRAWLWCDAEACASSVDVLFVDEAGQMSLADVVAVERRGEQPRAARRPAAARAAVARAAIPRAPRRSALEHLLGEPRHDPRRSRPVPRHDLPDASRRVRVRLRGASTKARCTPSPASNASASTATPPRRAPASVRTGRRTQGNRDAVDRGSGCGRRAARRALLGRNRGPTGTATTRPLDARRRPRRRAVQRAGRPSCGGALPDGARVGTVDKFQGQEAPVAIYSMATSSADDAPAAWTSSTTSTASTSPCLERALDLGHRVQPGRCCACTATTPSRCAWSTRLCLGSRRQRLVRRHSSGVTQGTWPDDGPATGHRHGANARIDEETAMTAPDSGEVRPCSRTRRARPPRPGPPRARGPRGLAAGGAGARG